MANFRVYWMPACAGMTPEFLCPPASALTNCWSRAGFSTAAPRRRPRSRPAWCAPMARLSVRHRRRSPPTRRSKRRQRIHTFRAAAKVYAVDVGSEQLHDSLRALPEVVSLEQTDIRTLAPALLDPPPDLIVCDVSFISLKLVLPPTLALTAKRAQLISLIKPQFEAGRAHLKKGIVRDQSVRTAVREEIAALVTSLGWHVRGVIPSPISGGDGLD